MATLKFNYISVKGEFAKALADDIHVKIGTAATATIKDAAEMVKKEGRAAIKQAGGHFTVKWQNAFRVKVYPDKGIALDPAMLAYHRIPFAGVFETGATISGSPLMWIPLPDVPLMAFGRRMSPKMFEERIGPLHIISRPGKPPLLAAYMAVSEAYMRGAGSGKITIKSLVAGARLSKSGRPGNPARLISIPLFIGINKVELGKRFNLQPVFDKANYALPAFFAKNLKAANG